MLKPRLILGHWDDMLRVAGSLKLGWVTASLFVAKLQSFRRQNVLTRALQEYGLLNKTIFILRYLFRRAVSAAHRRTDQQGRGLARATESPKIL